MNLIFFNFFFKNKKGASTRTVPKDKPATVEKDKHEPLQAGRWQRLLIPLVIILFALLIRYVIISRGGSTTSQ